MTDIPLIYTSKGNLPVDSLIYETRWEDAPDFIKFTEVYMLGDEVVKESAHIYSKRGLMTDAVAQPIS